MGTIRKVVQNSPRTFFQIGMILAAILSVGGLTFYFHLAVSRRRHVHSREQCGHDAERLTDAFCDGMAATKRELELLHSSMKLQIDTMTPKMWITQVEAISKEPIYQAIEWTPLLQHEDRAELEYTISTWLGESVELKDITLGGVRANYSEYVPVAFLEPIEGNEAALLIDLSSSDARRDTIYTARDTNLDQYVMIEQLVQTGQAGLLWFSPLEINATFMGCVLGVFRADELFKQHFRDVELHNVDLFSVTLRDTGVFANVSNLGASPTVMTGTSGVSSNSSVLLYNITCDSGISVDFAIVCPSSKEVLWHAAVIGSVIMLILFSCLWLVIRILQQQMRVHKILELAEGQTFVTRDDSGVELSSPMIQKLGTQKDRLDRYLSTAAGRMWLFEIFSQIHCEESILFYQVVLEFKRLANGDERNAFALAIYQNFIIGERQINITSTTAEQMRKVFQFGESQVAGDVFEKAEGEVLALMAGVMYTQLVYK